MRTLMRLTIMSLAALVSVWALNACSTLPSSTTATSLQQPYHEHIAIGGRFSVSYQQEGKPQSAQGRFQWRQRGEEVDIELLSPLGQTLARIRLRAFVATLERPGQAARSASSASELTEDMLGWAMPADGLRYWLQGYSQAATRTGAPTDTASSPATSDDVQAGEWQLRYVSWQTAEGGRHPKRIDLSRRSAAAGELGLRLVIDGWEPD
ncbi:MAG: putative Outer-rane lipoprotein precursor [Pseudomonadota bacterium]|jgi:outer membrane lipoprotein LolB|nr:outer membrane lipoprotein LolB [Oxalobacteraceae bacterium]